MPARILIVDDHPLNLKLTRVIVQAAGYEADIAQDAGEAEDRIREHRPDLILMDLQMPGVDGITLTRRLKADTATRDISVVALTAAAMASDRERAADAGCAGFVTKPLDTRTFPKTLARFLAASGALAA